MSRHHSEKKGAGGLSPGAVQGAGHPGTASCPRGGAGGWGGQWWWSSPERLLWLLILETLQPRAATPRKVNILLHFTYFIT